MTVTSAAARGQDTFVVAGKVVDSLTGAGVRRAFVRLDGFSGGVRLRREFLADAGGEFRFDGLPKGQLTVSASKPQFENQSANVAVGPSKESVELRMTPLGVITGRVTDGEGRPIQGVQVRAYFSVVREGRRRLEQQRAVSTDDLGDYRLWNLRSGSYYLKAVGRTGGTALLTTDRLPTYTARESFVPVYAGGATRFETASPLALAQGQQATADFQLPLEPAFKILGSVTNLEPYVTAKFELLSGTEEVSANRTFLNAMSGSFAVHDVVPGAYRLRVTQGEGAKRMAGEALVTVSGGDVGPIALRVHGTVDVPVRVETTGEASGGPPTEIHHRLGAPNCAPHLEETARGGPYYPAVQTGTGEGMTVHGVTPGVYSVRVACYGAYVTGLTAGGVDLMATGKLTLTPGAPAPELVVRSDRNLGRVSLEREGDLLPSPYWALIVPSGPSVEGPRLINVYAGKKDADLAPGEYTVFAMKGSDFPYREPQAIEQLRNGVRVQVSAGQAATVKLKELSE